MTPSFVAVVLDLWYLSEKFTPNLGKTRKVTKPLRQILMVIELQASSDKLKVLS